MEMLLAVENLVLVSGERETSGEYILMNSGGTSGEYILMNSEVNRFLFTGDVVSLRGWRSHWSVLLRLHGNALLHPC